MRTFRDRVRHALMFEAVALAIFIPGSAVVFNQPMNHMGVIGIASATIATLWNFVFNMGFDRAMLRLRGSVQKTMAIRVTHTFLFEAGLVVMLIPMIAWYLGIGLWAALLMDLAIVTFYLVYGFLFNIVYDLVFPVAPVGRLGASSRNHIAGG
ncbi:PACE efflux transporter [Massilia brevitalea]|uniref:PACE efflux transporter n=1 Tax=Massilia brevitalea TaxID=442526 RepID=UPI0027391CA2|nr:PACE efflux transporter [Massilia brevitalea]